jgi:hypothetical protein
MLGPEPDEPSGVLESDDGRSWGAVGRVGWAERADGGGESQQAAGRRASGEECGDSNAGPHGEECGDSNGGPQGRVPGIANGAPGRGAVAKHVTPGYQACNVIAGQVTPAGAPVGARTVGLTCRGTPPAAGRAWVPGCRARTLPSVRQLYDGSAVLERPSP